MGVAGRGSAREDYRPDRALIGMVPGGARVDTGRWWTVALAEAVQGDKALAVACEGERLALFRNDAGEVFALEDRCPHRRVPLSPGVVKAGGLQCPYHGWTFDGASGRCTDIPNLRRDERVPARYGAIAYPAAESHGFIHVWRGSGAPATRLPGAGYRAVGREYTGSAVANIEFGQYLDVMLDGPESLLAFAGVQITDFFLGDPRRDGAHLVLDRGAVWRGRGIAPAFVRDHPLLLRTRVPLDGGDIRVELMSAEETPLATVLIAASENRRGTTSLCWRGFLHADCVAHASWRWRIARAAGRPPFEVFSRIDGAAIASLEVAPSRERRAATSRPRSDCAGGQQEPNAA